MTTQPAYTAPPISTDSQSHQQYDSNTTPTAGRGLSHGSASSTLPSQPTAIRQKAATSNGAGRKSWLRLSLSHLHPTLSLSAAPLAALLFLATNPPALAQQLCIGIDEIDRSCTTITLGGNNLSRLPRGIFRGLNNLQDLWLSHNNLSSLPSGIFSGLNNLQELSVSANNLTTLPPGIFSGLNNLEVLWLDQNNLSSLPPGIFSGLNNLQVLSLDGNNLSCLPDLPSSLTKLYINNDTDNDINDPGLPPCDDIALEISRQTIRIDDPLAQLPFSEVLKQVADVATGLLFQRFAKRKPKSEEEEQVEGAVEKIEFVLDAATFASSVQDLLARDDVLTLLQQALDATMRRIGIEDYTVQLSARPEESVTVRIASNHPDHFVITPTTLTFTPRNYNSPQTVQVRPAFTIENYIDGNVPSLSTLSHTTSSGDIDPVDVQIGVIGSQPIRDHLHNALVDIVPDVQDLILQGLCALNPTCGLVLLANTVFELGQRIGEEINKVIADTTIDDALDYLAETASTLVGTAKARYQQEGMDGLVDYVSEQFSSADGVDPAPSVAAKPKAAVQSRIGARSAPGGASGGGGSDDLSFLDQALERSADFLAAHHQEINAGRFHLDLPQALALLGTDFNVPLTSLGLAQQAGQSDDASANRNMVLWGSVDYSQFGDQANNFSTNGRNWTFTVGVDGHLKPDLLTGLALSLSTARSDYDYVGSAMSGEYDVDLTVVTPYLNWAANDSLDLWASVGYGKGSSQFSLQTIGDLDLASVTDLDQDATRQSQDSDFFSFAGGLRWDAISSGDTQLAFKLAGSTTSFLETDSQQARLATQLSRDVHLANGVLSPSMDLALLLDSTNPSVMEVVAGLDWAAANDNFTASAVGRTLLFSGDRYEWGVGAALNYQAGVRPGEGLSLSLQPSLGVTDSHLAHLDILSSADDTHLAFRQWQPSARLNAQLRYGIPTGKAILTPYTQLNLMADHSTTYGAGLRYQLADSLDLDLSASHRQRTSGTNDNRLFLRLRTDL